MRKCSFKSDSGVRRALAELCEEGWLSKTSRSGKSSSGRRVQSSNHYQLSLDKLRAESAEPVQRAPSSKPAQPVQGEGSQGEPSQHEGSSHEGSQHEGSSDSQKGRYEPVPGAPDPSVTTDPPFEDKTFCQVAGQPDGEVVEESDPEVLITDQAILVLNHLNTVAGSKFQKSKTSLEHIRARLREGHTVGDLILAIDYKHEHWRNTSQYDYMQPSTLFRPSNFEGYLFSAARWNAKDRPARETWDSHRKPKNDTAFKATHSQVDYSLPENAGFRS
jgi:uncharacterized phage protein (TIGR02220 family)